MIRFTQGNLLEADVQAVVNTVNTVGIMGKGIALMFKDRFPDNFKAYEAACKAGEVETGRMFVTRSPELTGPRWIINFPTKQHWRSKTRPEWIRDGLEDLERVIAREGIRSIAVPPLGCGNGGLDWQGVRPMIEAALGDLEDVEIIVYEPTAKYQNVAKRSGVQKLTPARAMVAEMIRRYGVLGFDCTILEVQKLAWFLERLLERDGPSNPLDLQFSADRYGPYAYRLDHLLDKLDGSYLHCDKRIADASRMDEIRFEPAKAKPLAEFLEAGEGAEFAHVIERADALIDGFQTPLHMEVLATVDWLLDREGAEPTVAGIRTAINRWPAGRDAAERKQRVFRDRIIDAALARLCDELGEREEATAS